MPDYGLFGAEHVRQYEATGGKVGHDWNRAPVLVLHTTGRRSGQIRKFPLIYPEYDKYQPGTKRDIPVVLLNPR